MSDVKQRKKATGSPQKQQTAAAPKKTTNDESQHSSSSSLSSLLVILVIGSALFFGCSYYFTNSWTYGITLEHLRDPNKLIMSMHDTLKASGLPNFHARDEVVGANVDLSTGQVQNDDGKFGNANKGTEEVAKFQTSRLKVFTPKELEQYDGENGRPVFLGVKGRVYDVTKGRAFYGKGGSYQIMGAKDATIYLATGCSDEPCVKEKVKDGDYENLDAELIAGADGWIKSYNAKYTLVGFIKGRYERWNYPEAANIVKKATKTA